MQLSEDAIVEQIRIRLLVWGEIHLRDFPWRATRDPYAVLVAEVLLHRTQALQVVPVYHELVARYPDAVAFAGAKLDDLEELLYPLGLRWRIPLLSNMAKQLKSSFNGQVPPSSDLLQTLPGVGPYIASATVCFAFDLPEIILDTNTVRILGRLVGIPINDGSRRSKKFRTLMWVLLDQRNPRLFNLSLLDLAALVCLPSVPRCVACPLVDLCAFGRSSLGPAEKAR